MRDSDDIVRLEDSPLSTSLELDSGLDDVDYLISLGLARSELSELTWGVECSSDKSTNGTSQQVVCDLLSLGLDPCQSLSSLQPSVQLREECEVTDSWLGQEGLGPEDTSKVPSDPPNVSPERTLHTLVQSSDISTFFM